MNRIFWLIRGYLIAEITGASPEWVLNRLAGARIPFWNLQWIDEFTVRICLFRRDLEPVKQLASRAQCELTHAEEIGLRYTLRGIWKRPVFLVMIGLTSAVLCILPNFLLFFEVSGNETVEDAVILRALEELGIGIGTYGPDIKPKWINDHMLSLLPELQWVTVTQNGCMAEVVVRERPETPQTLERRGFAHVIATQSGMITSQSILAGQAIRKPGDFVMAGEMLVSGLVDLERIYTLEYAQAEIFARTWRQNTVRTPDSCQEQTAGEDAKHSLWIELGKKRIKIFGNSGISTSECDKMSKRKILSLPGGLKLPVSLLIETMIPCEVRTVCVSAEQAEMQLTSYAERCAEMQMRAGEVLAQQATITQRNGCYVLDSVLECHEMIAQTVEAKWNEEDFLYDGKNG